VRHRPCPCRDCPLWGDIARAICERTIRRNSRGNGRGEMSDATRENGLGRKNYRAPLPPTTTKGAVTAAAQRKPRSTRGACHKKAASVTEHDRDTFCRIELARRVGSVPRAEGCQTRAAPARAGETAIRFGLSPRGANRIVPRSLPEEWDVTQPLASAPVADREAASGAPRPNAETVTEAGPSGIRHCAYRGSRVGRSGF
jgi:hypothetical protein